MFELAFQAQREAVRLVAAVTVVASAEGKEWREIAEAAGTTEASARAHWGGAKAAELLAETSSTAGRRTQPTTRMAMAFTDGVLLPVVLAMQQGAQLLGNALKTLQRNLGVSPEELTQRAEVPVPAVHLVVDGQAVAPWTLTYVLIDLMEDDPEEIKWLWERAWYGRCHRDLAAGLGTLSAAFRGARIAAGTPELSAVSRRAGLAPEEAVALFEGRTNPDRSVFSLLIASLGADPEGLWPPQVPQHMTMREPQSGGDGT
ncbi:hypothetical protein ACFOOM_32665 [Streptomyces echinoruber]|uniref:Uncharacterized protein n=1 Tax=Streptomyces echinoruber TaxID=68898 RepID=A0A918S3C9_9ACTN|nr:hypothetical protein [Streptomyces echinoruber]GHA18732.1 hypothetical protein GCM10010389_65770 [Streptomyces echinoruber]